MIAHKTEAKNTQNISKECGTKQSSLDATVQQKNRKILSCDQCIVFGKPLLNQHDFCKTNTLSFMENHLRRLFYISRVSDLHESPAISMATHTL